MVGSQWQHWWVLVPLHGWHGMHNLVAASRNLPEEHEVHAYGPSPETTKIWYEQTQYFLPFTTILKALTHTFSLYQEYLNHI